MPNETAFASSHRQKKIWLTALAVLAVLVVFATVAALTMPASAMTGQGGSTPEIAETAATGETATPAPTEAPESVQAQEQAQADTAALPTGVQVPEGYTDKRTVRDEENGFAVTVYAPEGVIPADATLHATLLPTDSEEYKQAGEQLAEQTDLLPADGVATLSQDSETADGTEQDAAPSVGYAALDIHFEDADGNEIEPNGEVFVTIDAAGLIPEDADPDSVTVQHHAETSAEAEANDAEPQETPEIKVETVADTAPAEEGVEGAVAVTTPDAATEAATEEATVTAPEGKPETEVQVAFAVDGFSMFTITWSGRSGNHSVTVHYVDTNGNEILKPNTQNVEANNEVSLDSYRKDIEGFAYQKTVLDNYDSQNQVSQVRWNNKKWQYKRPNNDDWQDWRTNAPNIYIVYKRTDNTANIDTVATVDSTAEGVHMYMFNYGSDGQFVGGNYTEGSDANARTGDVKEGMLQRTTDDNNWPCFVTSTDTYTFTTSGEKINGNSLAWLFGDSDNAYKVPESYGVNNLFLKDRYMIDGTFYYSAFENFATLADDGDSGHRNFTVYNALGSPSNETAYYFQRGNFMPYNTLDTNRIVNRNLYSSEGEALGEKDPRYKDPIYGLNENPDFHFGMYIWADFYQPQGGQVESNDGKDSKQMIFEFTGDDDMWVYIDGVLVLDLGGIHDAQSGTINFATGEVRYTDTTSGSKPDWHNTFIKEQYEAAGRENSVDWNGNTFADGSNHRIQIFYMERGEGASNLKISFNLKTIPDGQLAVHKEVENYYAPQLEDVTYTMQVKVNDKVYANKPYTIQATSTAGTTDKNGCLTLTNDQTAVFPKLTVNDKVTVQEVGTSDTGQGAEISDKYKMSCTVTDSAGVQIPGSSAEDGVASATMPGYGSIVVNVTNTATFTRPLKLVKNFEGTAGNAAPNNFQATYTLYEVDEDGTETKIGSVKYSDLDDTGSYIFWLETGKTYTIKESFGEGDNNGGTKELLYSGCTAEANDLAESPVGTSDTVYVKLETSDATLEDETNENPVDTITLTNHYGEPPVSLTIIKNIYGLTRQQVVGLVSGEYRDDGGLKFDIDYFMTKDGAQHDNYKDKNDFIMDWTFSASQTLTQDSQDFVNGGTWDGYIQNGNEDITKDEENDIEHYGNSSLKEIVTGDETYYQYKITISDIEPNDWYHVWETHVDVSGYDMDTSVAAAYNNPADGTLQKYDTDHDTSTAFQLTKDTTVTFTNRYSPIEFTVTKVDAASPNIKLANAEFYLSREKEEGKTEYYACDDKTKLVTWVGEQAEATKLTSDPKQGETYGTFKVYGLPDGQYSLVEVKAPDGYQLPSENFTFTVTDGVVNHVSDNEQATKDTNITVTNTTGTELPETGGAGTNFLTIGGLLMMAAAVGGGCVLRRRRGREGN